MPVAGLILALDLANLTGFALGRPGEKPVSGTVDLDGKDSGRPRAIYNFQRWLADRWKTERPVLVVREAPFPLEAFRKRRNSQDGVQMAYGLHGQIEAACEGCGIPLESVHAATVRKHFVGRANAGERSRTKAAIVQRCWLLGLMPKGIYDDNRADAIATWDWAVATFGQRSAAVERLYLFGERAK